MRKFWMFAIAIVALSLVTPAHAQDACEVLLPIQLRTLLSLQHSSHRPPLAADSAESLCRKDRIREGRTECLLATTADFNGDGERDYAAVMPARKVGDPPLLVTALGEKAGAWKLLPLRIGTQSSNLVLSVLKPGDYRETAAALPTGVTGRKVSTRHEGLMFGVCDSWAAGYFYLDGGWFSMALSD